LDPVNLGISLFTIIGGMAVVYLLRKQKLEVALGIGGSTAFLGLVSLAADYRLISGISVWIITGSVLVILACFFYVAEKGKWAPR